MKDKLVKAIKEKGKMCKLMKGLLISFLTSFFNVIINEPIAHFFPESESSWNQSIRDYVQFITTCFYAYVAWLFMRMCLWRNQEEAAETEYLESLEISELRIKKSNVKTTVIILTLSNVFVAGVTSGIMLNTFSNTFFPSNLTELRRIRMQSIFDYWFPSNNVTNVV